MMRRYAKVLVAMMAVLVMVVMTALPAAALTVTGVSGVEVTVNSSGDVSESGGTVTVTVKGSNYMRKTATVTVKNTSGSKATVSFDYTVANYNASNSTIDDLAGAASGSYSIVLGAGDTKTFTVSADKKTTATATLSNFKVEAVTGSAGVTVAYDSAMGSVTADSAAVSNGETVSVGLAAGATFKATAGSGNVFVAWVNAADHSVLSTSASFTYVPTKDSSIKAVFTNAAKEPCFFAGGKGYLFESFDAAIAYAQSNSNKVIVLAADGTLAAGTYTVPAGVTLQIPYNSSHTLNTTAPSTDAHSNYENVYGEGATFAGKPITPTMYRTLTMSNGAHLVVNGALSLCGTQWSGGMYAGCVTGPTSHIAMKQGSTITVNSGAFLYAWGFISGSGEVHAKSGATVYEDFQVGDWRGGSITSTMAQDTTHAVFPMSQYYVQNVQVPLYLYTGAAEKAVFSVEITLLGTQTTPLSFIGTSDSMFHLLSGYVIKDYDEARDRMNITVRGDVNIEPITIQMKLAITEIFGGTKLDTSKFEVPINNHMTVYLESGNMTINQDMVLLPGAEFFVSQGVNCTLGSGVSMYLYDLDQWGGYCTTGNYKFVAVPYAYGRQYTRTEADLKDAKIVLNGTIDATNGYLYVTSGGADVTSQGTGKVTVGNAGTQTEIYRPKQSGSDSVTYTAVSLIPAVAKDSDGTKVSCGTAGTYTYYAATGKWCVPGHRMAAGAVTAPTCSAQGYTTYSCVACGHSEKKDYTEMVAHSYNGVVTAPSCEVGGYTTFTCVTCGHSYVGEETGALGSHLGRVIPGTPATCTESGLTDGEYCDRCNQTIVSQTTIPALGHTEVTDPAEPATCTDPGLTAGKHCSACGVVLQEQRTVAATGHSYQQTVTAPTLGAQGYTTHTCSACDDSYIADYTQPLAKIDSWGLTLDDGIRVNFKVVVDASVQAQVGARIVITVGEGEYAEIVIYYLSNNEASDTEYLVSTNMGAAQMGDTITVKILTDADEGIEKTYSIKAYAETILADQNYAQYHDVVKAMLTYGAAAQTYFDYKTEAMVPSYECAVEVPEFADYAIGTDGGIEGIEFYGATMIFREKIAVRYYFTGDAAKVTTMEGLEIVAVDENNFYVEVSHAIADLDTYGYAVLYSVENEESMLWVDYSAMNYVVRMNQNGTDNLKALLKALYNYHTVAAALVESKNAA